VARAGGSFGDGAFQPLANVGQFVDFLVQMP